MNARGDIENGSPDEAGAVGAAENTTVEADRGADVPPAAVGARPVGEDRDRTGLYQLIGGVVALVAITAVIAVLITRSMLQAPDPEVEGRVRGTSFDSFNRADGGTLETSATGRPWQVISGDWSIKDSRAVATPDADAGGATALALLDTGVSDQYVQATFFDPEAGSGLVTRFQGPNNFVGVTFAPTSGTVQLGVTVDGRRAEPSKIGSALAEGEVTLGVRTEGESVIVYVNGIESGRQVVPELREGTRVGMLVRAGDQPDSAIDDVVAVPLSTEPMGLAGGGGGQADEPTDDEGQDGTTEGDGDANADGAGAADTKPGDTEPGAADTKPGDTKPGAPTPGALEPGGAPTP